MHYLPSVELTIDLNIATSQSTNSNTTLTLVVSSCYRNSVHVITVTFLGSIAPSLFLFPLAALIKIFCVRFSELCLGLHHGSYNIR